MRELSVVLAIISNDQQEILVTQRNMHVSQGGYWEFPGGKIEENEHPESALIREVREEIGLEILNHQFLGEVKHQYPEKNIQLLIFWVTQFTGEAVCLEGQLGMKWLKKHEINPDDFPEANRQVILLIPNFVNTCNL